MQWVPRVHLSETLEHLVDVNAEIIAEESTLFSYSGAPFTRTMARKISTDSLAHLSDSDSKDVIRATACNAESIVSIVSAKSVLLSMINAMKAEGSYRANVGVIRYVFFLKIYFSY